MKVAPGAAFWQTTACRLLETLPAMLVASGQRVPAGHDLRPLHETATAVRGGADLSGVRIVVPSFGHAQQLREALAREIAVAFIPPRICTMPTWLAMQLPDRDAVTPLSSGNQRLMSLYAELRQHAWLKKLFSARRNPDLLPLAQTLLALADELTAVFLPVLDTHPGSAEERWEAALAQLPLTARSVLSEEAQLVWSIWKSQLDTDDPAAARFARMRALAARANTPLVWIDAEAPDPCSRAFLEAWAERQPALTVGLDWRHAALPVALTQAWPEILMADDKAQPSDACMPGPGTEAVTLETHWGAHGVANDAAGKAAQWSCSSLALSPASSLEDEAQNGAQTVVDWLEQGKTSVAVVVQDRVVARRIRALLQRAQVQVADETGWKLSTTRAAAALAAWFEVVTSRAESIALLDFLKSPFMLDDVDATQVMAIEIALRRANVAGGWRAVLTAVPGGPARDRLQQVADQAARFRGRRTVAAWLALTWSALDELGMSVAYAADAAGAQVCAMLQTIGEECAGMAQEFSFAEWRACLSLQLESTAFLPPVSERRVVMLPLGSMHLRTFEAVLVVGADADHLPSASGEALFFANAVRRELALATRESYQLQQLRWFAEVLAANRTVVLSWQAYRDGEPNPVSTWVARLDLQLQRSCGMSLPEHHAPLALLNLVASPPSMPAPVAPHLLPARLSASGYGSLVACPYQFFAAGMLGLSGLNELSELPEKRDYGDWLHQILHLYHTGVRDQLIGSAQRSAFLQAVTERIFDVELDKSAAALGYYDRWQKAMPAYLSWAEAREAQGWQFVGGEQWAQQSLRWHTGEVILQGRIDRIDRNGAGDTEVLDYKASSVATLKKRMEANEDHQLAFYGLLFETPAAGAAYVALEPHRDKIHAVAAPDFIVRQEQLRQQISGAMQAISEGAGLRASGSRSVCQYCEVRGLCRKGAW